MYVASFLMMSLSLKMCRTLLSFLSAFYSLFCCYYKFYLLGLKLTRSFTSVTLLEGNTITISCTPNITEAVLYWVYNDNGTNITESTARIQLSPPGINHNLTIVNPVTADSGTYFCRTVNEDLLVEDKINVSIVPGMYVLGFNW